MPRVAEIFTKAKDHLRAIAGDSVAIIKKAQDETTKAVKEIKLDTDIKPVVSALTSVEKAIVEKEDPKEISVSNLQAIEAGLGDIVETLKSEINGIDREVVVKNDLSQLTALLKTNQDKKTLIEALKKIEDKIQQPESVDYTMILSDIATAVENKDAVDVLKRLLEKEYSISFPAVMPVDLDPNLIEEDRLKVKLSDEQVSKMGASIAQGGDNKSVFLLDEDGDRIGVQAPLSTDGDSVYEKDVDAVISDVGTFTGSIASLFNAYEGTIALEDTSATNPKWYKVKLNRPLTTSKITIGTNGHTFSNVKLTLMSGGGEVVATIDDSSNSTGYINNTYHFSPIKFNVVKVEFYTADAMYIAGMSINKDVEVVARLQALKPNGELTDIDATTGGNLKVAIEEMELEAQTPFNLRVAKGEISGHSIVSKFGQNNDIGTGAYEDIWDGGGTYVYPADGTAPITKLVAHDAADTEPIEVQGLDINGDLVIQTKTLAGTTAVTLDTPLWRMFRLKNVGTSDLVDDVCAINDGDTVDYGCINNGNNQTLMALYTIPAGKTGYLLQGTNSIIGALRDYNIQGKLWMRPFGLVFQLKKTFGLDTAGTGYINMPFPLPGRIPEKTDVRVSAISSKSGGGLNTTFEILLIDN